MHSIFGYAKRVAIRRIVYIIIAAIFSFFPIFFLFPLIHNLPADMHTAQTLRRLMPFVVISLKPRNMHF